LYDFTLCACSLIVEPYLSFALKNMRRKQNQDSAFFIFLILEK